MKVIICVTIFLFAFLNFNLASEPTQTQLVAYHDSQKIPTPKSLLHLGLADGKNYFYDNEVLHNWTGAKEYCQSAGMQMGSLTTQAQFDLMSNLQGGATTSRFWTSGRESQDFSMYTWDAIPGSNLTWDVLYGFEGLRGPPFTICLVLDGPSGRFLALEECNYPCHVLCEITVKV